MLHATTLTQNYIMILIVDVEVKRGCMIDCGKYGRNRHDDQLEDFKNKAKLFGSPIAITMVEYENNNI
ncbi:hypothetical protein Lal_00031944 [Lupinus albus]|nr:hypothetical protein Lal_00031944 [Lupinus albus]